MKYFLIIIFSKGSWMNLVNFLPPNILAGNYHSMKNSHKCCCIIYTLAALPTIEICWYFCEGFGKSYISNLSPQIFSKLI